ncbi:hypothetical protein IWQ62_006203 [Dispira parvispora]|uniref:Uncharacterized protein n=1 Tax=Dispira parvispora TaxID=1520584 RepID=A0A9W8AII6_9FUNG|nr:hypothetical protein IWQ62_006203 [Dispira parvispora]
MRTPLGNSLCFTTALVLIIVVVQAAFHHVPHWTNPDTVEEDRRRMEQAMEARRRELFDTLGYAWPDAPLPQAMMDPKGPSNVKDEL